MRSAALVLGLTAALAVLLWTERRLAVAAPERELPVRLFSRGERWFPRPCSEQGLHGEISLADADLFGPVRSSGLRVALISAQRELTAFRNFDLQHSPDDVRALIELCESAPLETVLALCTQGGITPRGDDESATRGALAELFTQLDALAPPLESPSPSWALLTLRRRDGWVRLAESRADEVPTRLSFLVRPAGFEYERRESRLRRDGELTPPAPANAATSDTAGPELAHASGPSVRCELASVASYGARSNGQSGAPCISADGRFIAFASVASNLVRDDRNECSDVFVHDRVSGTTERVSVASDGSEGDGPASDPTISGDGQWVAFQSRASNVEPRADGTNSNIFVHDRATHTTRRISVSLDRASERGNSLSVAIAGDGSAVAFESRADQLIEGDTNRVSDVFFAPLAGGPIERVSVNSAGGELDGDSRWPALSADARLVAFTSRASNAVAGAPRKVWSIYVFERATRRLELASCGWPANSHVGDSLRPSLSGDGRFVAFESDTVVDDMLAGDAKRSVFVHDRASGLTRRIATPWAAASVAGDSRQAQLSRDGNCLVFLRYFDDGPATGVDPLGHVYRFDLRTEQLQLVDALADGSPAEPGYFHHSGSRPGISDNGRYIAFTSASDALAPGDDNGQFDVLVREFAMAR